jgi:hypothetical protein
MRIAFAICVSLLIMKAPALGVTTVLPNPPPEYRQVRELIQNHLPGVSETELNQAALEGLLQSFRGKVRLIESGEPPARPNISQSSVFDEGIAYLRVAQVAGGLAAEVTAQCQALNTTNKLKGLVLDLRFTEGDDYAAATATADLFVAEARDLLDWGNGVVKSSSKTNALNWPVVVLVNGETSGAPEALAAVLRETGAGLILGNTTRGAAMTATEFPLANGQRIRIAAAPVKLANKSVMAGGVTPDIQVSVTVADEQVFLSDPYAVLNKTATLTNLTTTGTNRVLRRVRTTEADLVRARREGLNPDGDFVPQREVEPEKPVIRDPALARAVDLLKGLAVVRRLR